MVRTMTNLKPVMGSTRSSAVGGEEGEREEGGGGGERGEGGDGVTGPPTAGTAMVHSFLCELKCTVLKG